MVLSKSSAEATGVVAKGDILEVVDEKSTQVWKVDCSTMPWTCPAETP
jgi:hypothetical protein